MQKMLEEKQKTEKKLKKKLLKNLYTYTHYKILYGKKLATIKKNYKLRKEYLYTLGPKNKIQPR